MSETEPKQERRRAWVWWAGGLAALLVLGVALQPILLPRLSPATWAAYDRIEKGMTRAEVERVLGGPPGQYVTRPTEYSGMPELAVWSDLVGEGESNQWFGDEGQLMVRFDSEGLAIGKGFLPSDPKAITYLELIHWHLVHVLGGTVRSVGLFHSERGFGWDSVTGNVYRTPQRPLVPALPLTDSQPSTVRLTDRTKGPP